MPRERKTRVAIASSYAAPSSSVGNATWPPRKPAAAASGFEYWNISPNLLVGWIVASVFKRGFGRDALVLEQPLVVLARESGARADQMLDEHATRGVGIAELERR